MTIAPAHVIAVKLLASIQQHTKPVQAAELGSIGKEHLHRMMEIAGADPKTFKYRRCFGETNGVPQLIDPEGHKLDGSEAMRL